MRARSSIIDRRQLGPLADRVLSIAIGLCLSWLVGACELNEQNPGVLPTQHHFPATYKAASAPGDTPDLPEQTRIITAAVAERMGVQPGVIKVEFPNATVPGLAVFKAIVTSAQPVAYSVGVVHQGEVITDRADALKRVVAAWGYGARRTVPVVQVAAVFGALEVSDQAWRPILTREQIDAMSSRRRQMVFLPREATVDGKPAVQYWVKSVKPPLSLTTAIIEPDGSVTMDRQEHWVF